MKYYTDENHLIESGDIILATQNYYKFYDFIFKIDTTVLFFSFDLEKFLLSFEKFNRYPFESEFLGKYSFKEFSSYHQKKFISAVFGSISMDRKRINELLP